MNRILNLVGLENNTTRDYAAVPDRDIAADDRGGAALESALSIGTLIVLCFWIFEFCMVIYSYNVLGDAAREGIRYAIVHGNDSSNCSGPQGGCGDSSAANVKNVVSQYAALSYHNISGATVSVSYPDGDSKPPNRVLITISYPYVPYLTLPGLTPTLTVSAEGRVMY